MWGTGEVIPPLQAMLEPLDEVQRTGVGPPAAPEGARLGCPQTPLRRGHQRPQSAYYKCSTTACRRAATRCPHHHYRFLQPVPRPPRTPAFTGSLLSVVRTRPTPQRIYHGRFRLHHPAADPPGLCGGGRGPVAAERGGDGHDGDCQVRSHALHEEAGGAHSVAGRLYVGVPAPGLWGGKDLRENELGREARSWRDGRRC